MGNGSIHENGTIGIKLTNGENTALKNKTVHVCVKDSEGKIVVDKTAKTYVSGVVGVGLTNVSAGEYDVNVTFEGDENYTSSSVSQKLKIIAGESDDGGLDTDYDENGNEMLPTIDEEGNEVSN